MLLLLSLFLLLPCYVFAQTATADRTPPSLMITNGRVSATLLPPDAQRGYYRGARFDWAGVVQSLSAGGHTYFGLGWNERPYRPELHDAVGGPVEEFGAVGYDSARVGATFLKIGIGMVRRLDEKPHFFANEYPIVNSGTWTTDARRDRATFRHVLNDTPGDRPAGAASSGGYGYRYEKTLRLLPGKTQLVLEHRLTNTGQKVLETDVYNHNFLMLDGQPSGPDLSVTFADTVAATPALPAPLRLDGARLTYERPLTAQEAPFVTLVGETGPAPPYDFRVEHRASRAGVRVTSDRPMSKLNVWSNARNLSPEPYIALRILPGQTATWTITYDFYEVK